MSKSKTLLENKLVVKYLNNVKNSLIDKDQDDEFMGIENCESAIEAVMYMALKERFKNLSAFVPSLDFMIENQSNFSLGGKTYRADICLTIYNLCEDYFKTFIIECDGHEFHEKTKEQVRKDRSRERAFLKEGNTVIRFSGSEIFECPDYCAYEVLEIVKANVERLNN